MATTLLTKPEFIVLREYAIPQSTDSIYTKLNNHHGDQFGKCKITTGGEFKVAKIQILNSDHTNRSTTFAIWAEQGNLKIQNAFEGKTTLRGVAMVLIEADELPAFIQRQIA